MGYQCDSIYFILLFHGFNLLNTKLSILRKFFSFLLLFDALFCVLELEKQARTVKKLSV